MDDFNDNPWASSSAKTADVDPVFASSPRDANPTGGVGPATEGFGANNYIESTLDEPVFTTIMRDVKMVGKKISYVMVPRPASIGELRNWDLWGPFILCLTLAIMLSVEASDQAAVVFAAVFSIVGMGAVIVTLNVLLLGGTISFFQSVCVLGYCIFPLNVAELLVIITRTIFPVLFYWWLNFIFVMACFAWATFASVGFMGQLVSLQRRALAVYPVFLFYLSVSWMIMVTK